jgi:hypothetical protein
MRHQFSYTLGNTHTYLLHYGPNLVGEVFWIFDLLHPSNTMARIVEGLNGVAETEPRTWELRPTAHDTRRVGIFHNGREEGEIGWLVEPRNPARLHAQIAAALNHPEHVTLTETPIPEPAPPRHLRAVPKAS